MARILNLIVVILELTAVSSFLLVIFGQRYMIEVFRFLSAGMLVMTFFVTTCILVPMSGRVRELLFSGSGLYHLILPGRWYVMPTFKGDHMSLQGGLTKRVNVRPFYLDMVRLIAGTAAEN